MPDTDPYRKPDNDETNAVPQKPKSDANSSVPESTSNWRPDSTVKSGPRNAAFGTGSLPAKIGRFEIRAVLGEGAFGRVYRGFDAELERDVAIKVPHGSEMTAGFRERFLREARAAAHIHHPNVCPIYQAGTDGEVPYLVMHFVDGPTLGSLLEKRQTRFSPKQACVVIRKLALGVAAAHAQGVVHRDLKPQNVLVDEVRREVLITDFGVARVGDAGQTVEGDVIGTPAYMSPEQAQGKRTEVGPLSDVYSLGVILYRLLTGVVPYTGSVYEVLIQVYEGKPRPPQELRPGLDPRLCEICLKAMAKEPRDRYQSATDLATALETYMRSGNMESSGEREILVGAANRPEAPRKEAEARAGAAAVPEVETEIAFDLPTTARPMLSLMRNIAEAVFAKGLKELSVRVADVTFAQELARETIRRAKATRSTSLRQMVETTAGANIADAQVAAAQAAWEVAGTASEEDRLSLEMYLGQLPDTIRKPLKRAEDPTGTTVPREFSVETPEKFLEVLPRRVPRFRGGQAVPGRSDWVLVRWLGAGGFGEVWLAAHRRIPNRFGAVKFGIDLSRKQRELLTHEARLAAVALDRKPHPGLVPLLDTELGGETPWLMYEYIGGGDLTDLMLAWQQLPPAGRINAAVGRLRELAEAIAALHRLQPPVVHRDLKPANILRDSRTFQLRVTDFGIGGIAVENQVGRKRDSMLTELRGAHSLLYASPQQQRGAAPDPRDDVHALGVLAFHMLTGRLTSGVPTDYDRILRKLNVPVGLIQIIGACAAAEPNHRPRDAQAIVDMLAALDTAPDQQRNAGPISLQPDNQKVTPVEVLVCPVCKARLQVPAGRTELVPCPRCLCQFPPAAGRKEILSLDPEPMPLPPPPPPVPAPAPIRRKKKRSEQPATEEETPRRSLRFYSCGCFLFLLAALGAGGFAYQDELIAWGKTHLAKPIEFTPGREFETGADTARVYGFVRGEQSLLLTNSSRKDILATVWKAKNVAAMCNLKGGPAISTTVLDPKTTQFRYHNGRLAVFNRDPQAIDKGGVYLFDLIPAEKELDEVLLKIEKPSTLTNIPEVNATLLDSRRVWDVNSTLSHSVTEPRGAKMYLRTITSGFQVQIAELSAEGSTFRAAAFSPDGKYLVGLCDQSWLRVWDVDSGKLERSARLAVRPSWDGTEVGSLAFDPAFTRVSITTDSHVGVWSLTTGTVVEPMKPLRAGVPLKSKYRLRVETAGRGTFSVFHDEFTFRACKLTISGGGDVTTWCVNDDNTVLAVSSQRKIQLWNMRIP